jgi:hypothetical protein
MNPVTRIFCWTASLGLGYSILASTGPELEITPSAWANSPTNDPAQLRLERKFIEGSPVLRRWLNSPPDLLEDIRENPSFNSKLQVSLTSRDRQLGIEVGAEDIFLGKTAFTLNGAYQRDFDGKAENINLNLRYYLLPLGSYFNLAPLIGYRSQAIAESSLISGLDLGFQGILALSPLSADLRLAQTWTSLGSNSEISTTRLSASYALSTQLRLASSIQWQRSPLRADSRVGIGLEWAF